MLGIIPMVMWHSELFYILNKQIRKISRGHTKRKEEDTFGVLLGRLYIIKKCQSKLIEGNFFA